METLDPIKHDVVEGRVAHVATAAAPADVGGTAVGGRIAPASFSCRHRHVDPERRSESPERACFELGLNQLVYASTPSAPQRAQHIGRQGRLSPFTLLHDKQREVIWQLKSDASP
jgi:hypothetical protein